MSHLGLSLFLFLAIFIQVEAADDFVRVRGVHFLLNGNPYYANGFNAYWLMYEASDPSQRHKISTAFREASSRGLTIARTWAFSDGGYRPLQYSPGSYNEQTFKGLDFTISEARKYGIKLILSLVNNYEHFGGKKQYVEWARSKGQWLNSEDDFFRNAVLKDYYKNHVRTVLTRKNSFTGIHYKDDPTIMAWELMNEPRCTSDTSGRTIQEWIAEMASFVKSIDRNHLLEVGLEGFYGQSTPEKFNSSLSYGTDFITNNKIPEIDFTTIHSYPESWWFPGSSDQKQLEFINDWLSTHIQDSENILKKPLLYAEFGKPGKHPNQRDILYNMVYDKMYSSAKRGGAASGSLYWQLLNEGMDSMGDGYEIVFSQSPSTANIIAQQSHKLYMIRNVERWKRARTARNRGRQIGN